MKLESNFNIISKNEYNELMSNVISTYYHYASGNFLDLLITKFSKYVPDDSNVGEIFLTYNDLDLFNKPIFIKVSEDLMSLLISIDPNDILSQNQKSINDILDSFLNERLPYPKGIKFKNKEEPVNLTKSILLTKDLYESIGKLVYGLNEPSAKTTYYHIELNTGERLGLSKSDIDSSTNFPNIWYLIIAQFNYDEFSKNF